MALMFSPLAPWHFWVTALGLVLTAGLWLAVLRGRMMAWSRRAKVRGWILACSQLAIVALVLAAWRPQLVRPGKGRPVQVAVVLDVSESVRGGTGGWRDDRDAAENMIQGWVKSLPGEMADAGTAGIFTLQGEATLTVPRHRLRELPQKLAALDALQFASGEGSHLAAGLNRAADWMAAGEGQGICVLVTDGHQTRGDVLLASEALVRQGIPVHVLPADGAGPDLDLTAADLPSQIVTSVATYLRAVLRNGLDRPVEASLSLRLNGGAQSEANGQTAQSQTVSLDAGAWRRLRWPLQFRGTGIQFADLSLTEEGGKPRERRFYTYIHQSPRVLIVGGDYRIAETLPAGEVIADMVAPPDVAEALRSAHYDSVVLSGVTASDLGLKGVEEVAWAVKKEGMGLFVINGDHGGLDEETETVLMSYNDTELEDLLPVSSRPRPYQPEAPGREVVVLLDASGSMGGWRLRKSQEIVAYIIENLMRSRDRLILLTFSTGARILVDNRYMDQAGKFDALSQLWAIKASGGTDPSFALDLLGSRRLRNCGLIFLSDGEFDQVTYRPDCRATVFAIGTRTVPDFSPLWGIADPFPVTEGFNPAGIEMPFFEQETRNRFFEPGRFTPLGMDRFLARKDRMPIPPLPLVGSAVTFAKDEATLVAVRPKLTDPVLAYAEGGLGYVGVFTGALADGWLNRPEGRDALASWVLRTVGFTARDRYRFEVRDLGNALEIEVGLVAHGGQLPSVSQLHGDLVIPGLPTQGLSFTQSAQEPGVFKSLIRLNDIQAPSRAKLILRESGPGAVARPQAVPIFVPPAGGPRAELTAERYSHGTHEGLLQALAETTGGVYAPDSETPVFPMTPSRVPPIELWQWLVAFAGLTHLAAVALQRMAG